MREQRAKSSNTMNTDVVFFDWSNIKTFSRALTYRASKQQHNVAAKGERQRQGMNSQPHRANRQVYFVG
ncbi:hypothetical protein [Vibrio superstes]|uniref:Uncharacterized protein n=1 Tax=Vibrio superstes NBRC 103154 TaxID=1219062 RepID=A0A511QKK1_9VIBR|nr:hypothetical protein [Vibrio superstes]GEM77854.1 hypothetical protein VSU01S_00990 [Vibrio superstes NBRC 103154]